MTESTSRRKGHRCVSHTLLDGPSRLTGFTLIELILVLSMLVTVLAVAYGMILDCLKADRTIDKLTLPEKIGDGILTLFREDLSGTIYRHMGTRIFLVTDGGVPPDARDEIHFLSTSEPTPYEEATGESSVLVQELRTITGICYFLRPTETQDGLPAYTLFRKEVVDLDPESPLESPGINYEVYDKVRYLNIECFDGWAWVTDWDSNLRILEEQNYMESIGADREGRIARVSDPQRSNVPGITIPGVDPTALEEETVLPPAGIPVAVRIEIGIYVYAGNKVERDRDGYPLTKIYSTIVPLLVAQRLPIQLEDDTTTDLQEGVAGAGDTDVSSPNLGNNQLPPAGLNLPGLGSKFPQAAGSRRGAVRSSTSGLPAGSRLKKKE